MLPHCSSHSLLESSQGHLLDMRIELSENPSPQVLSCPCRYHMHKGAVFIKSIPYCRLAIKINVAVLSHSVWGNLIHSNSNWGITITSIIRLLTWLPSCCSWWAELGEVSCSHQCQNSFTKPQNKETFNFYNLETYSFIQWSWWYKTANQLILQLVTLLRAQ